MLARYKDIPPSGPSLAEKAKHLIQHHDKEDLTQPQRIFFNNIEHRKTHGRKKDQATIKSEWSFRLSGGHQTSHWQNLKTIHHDFDKFMYHSSLFYSNHRSSCFFCILFPPKACLIRLLKSIIFTFFIFFIISTNISFPLGKMIGTVRSWTSFILSSQSWEIGSPPTGGAGGMK